MYDPYWYTPEGTHAARWTGERSAGTVTAARAVVSVMGVAERLESVDTSIVPVDRLSIYAALPLWLALSFGGWILIIQFVTALLVDNTVWMTSAPEPRSF